MSPTIATRPRLATMSTPDVLAKYGLSNPFSDAVAFTREAEKLRAALRMKTIEVRFTGAPMPTYTRMAYTVQGYDEHNQLLAVTRDDAADALADVARENARRFGVRKREELQSQPEAAPLDASTPVAYARPDQKELIIRLLNHPMITRPEKTKQLLNINRLREAEAEATIAALCKTIEAREAA